MFSAPGSPGEPAWLRADALAMTVKAARDRVAVPLARAAAGFVRQSGWFCFGYARLGDCAREQLGRSAPWVRQLAELGTALEALPSLAAALTGDDGGRPLGMVAARMVGRVATTASLAEWVAVARRLTVRELRHAVDRARQTGSAWPARVDAGGLAKECPDSGEGMNDEGSGLGNLAMADPENLRLLRFMVPEAVAKAFDEALELFRAVAGGQAPVAEFVEAVVADATAGGHVPEDGVTLDTVDRGGSGSGDAVAAAEMAMARATGRWSHLQGAGGGSWGLAMVGASLARLAAVGSRAGEGDAVELAAQIRELIDLAEELDRHLGRLLVEMSEMGAWEPLRFDSVEHYAEERLGMGRTSARERVVTWRGLRRYPRLRSAYENGEIGLESALHILRILDRRPVDAATERAWVDHGKRTTIKRLRDERRAFLRRGAIAAGTCPSPMPDDAWHDSLRREPGLARARLRQFGRALVLDSTVASADVFLGLRLPADLARDLLAAVESARRRMSALAAEASGGGPGESESWSLVAARMFFLRGRRTPAWIGLLALLEEFVATWDVEDSDRRPAEREIYARAGYRCTAAACTGRRSLESHHLTYRSRGGGEELSNKTCLCAWHHRRGEHGELASFRGKAPLGVLCRLGRADVATWFRNEMRVEPVGGLTPSAGP